MVKGLLEKYEMVLYHTFPTRSTRVKWLILELGVEDAIKTQYVDVTKGEQRTKEFLSVNPMGAIPALTLKHRDTGEMISMTESTGICLFLMDACDSQHADKLRPERENVGGMAIYHRVIALSSASIDPVLWDIRKHEQILPADKRVGAIAQQARLTFKKFIVPTVESLLYFDAADDDDDDDATCHFVCFPYHDQFTTADVVLAYCLFWADLYSLNSPRMKSYLHKISQRESFQRIKQEPSMLRVTWLTEQQTVK